MAETQETKTKKDLAFALFDLGKRPSDPEVKNLDMPDRTTYEYFEKWKRKQRDSKSLIVANEGNGEKQKDEVAVVAGSAKKPVASKPPVAKQQKLGEITVVIENWTISQHGAIIILDTYRRAKIDMGYGGTVGEFLVDAISTLRRILDYEKEVPDEWGTDGEGGSIPEEGSREVVEGAAEPAQ